MDAIMDRIREDERLKRRLIILGVLLLALGFLAFMLNRKVGQKQAIAGSSFSFLVSIYDLTSPLGVATDSDENVYVSNTGASEVIVFDKEGIRQRTLGETLDEKGEPLRFFSPYGLAVDDLNDKVYVADYSWGGVRVLSKGGEFLYNLPRDPNDIQLDPQFGFAPYGVATDGESVYVVSKDGVYVFDNEGGFKTHWGTRGQEIGNYDFPNGIAMDSGSGNIFVADQNNRRIVSLDRDGKVRWTLGAGLKEDATSVFQLPRSVTVGNDGLVYISDIFDHKIVVVDQDGNLISKFGERGTEDGKFNFPEGLAVSASSRLYVADRQNNRLQIWQLAEPMPKITAEEKNKWAAALIKP